jgi:transposase
MDDQSKRSRKTYSEEFKRDAVRLVVVEGYSFKSACAAVGVCNATLRAWHAKLAPPPESCGDNATVEELQQENQRLRKEL